MWLPYDIGFGIYRDKLAVILYDESEMHFKILEDAQVKNLKELMEKFEI